jgi:zinc transport system ATP-binding protein
METVIDIKDLTFSYGKFPALSRVTMEIKRQDFTAIIGPNGGGKTTLIKLILGFLKPDTGTISVLGKHPEQSLANFGYVPQFVDMDNNFPISVIDVVTGGLIRSSSLFPWNRNEMKEAARKSLESMEVLDLEDSVFGKLSGGQRQRVLIARAIVSEPEILVLDEPTTSVDSRIEKNIYDLLKFLNKKMTIILVTHDLGFVSQYINRILCVNKSVGVHSPETIDDSVIQETYKSPMNLVFHQCNL